MDYTQAGFDGFLSRSIDNYTQNNLSTPGPMSTQSRYEDGQKSGGTSDTFRIGNITFDGVNSRIIINDDNSNASVIINGQSKRIEINDTTNTRVLAGQLPDGNYGWAVSKTGSNVQNGFTS